MKVGVIISSGDPEVLYNGIRFANFCLEQNDEVTLFLNAKAVEYYKYDSPQYKLEDLVKTFVLSDGVMLA